METLPVQGWERPIVLTSSLPTAGQTESRGRLQGVAELRLAGLELTDASLRLLLRHAPQLSALDLSHCAHVGDPSVHLLTAPTSPLRETLVHLNLAGKRHPLSLHPSSLLGPVVWVDPQLTFWSQLPSPHPQVVTASRTTASRCSAAARASAVSTCAPAASSPRKLVPGWQPPGPLAPSAAQKRSCFSRTASWVPPTLPQDSSGAWTSGLHFTPARRPGHPPHDLGFLSFTTWGSCPGTRASLPHSLPPALISLGVSSSHPLPLPPASSTIPWGKRVRGTGGR